MSGGVQEGSELPEWMQDQQHEEKSDGQEMTLRKLIKSRSERYL
ncbi:hypothetical protein [Paenibacillus sp. JZ16]|nr:hypothetical protein [Paenibacillus sp. JZ16]